MAWFDTIRCSMPMDASLRMSLTPTPHCCERPEARKLDESGGTKGHPVALASTSSVHPEPHHEVHNLQP